MAGQVPTPRAAICTIISCNYLALARTLMQSVEQHHPECARHVLLVDENRGRFDPAAERFQVLPVADLALPHARRFLYRYSLLELNTAVKPWFLQRLFEQYGYDQVTYLDPDIALYGRLDEVTRSLADSGLAVLTPHLTAPVCDTLRPSEHDILKAGTYNLGFLALRRHPRLADFLRWWQTHLEYDCRVNLAENLFVDQRWMDLAPALFPDVQVLRDPGYNVAYWNVHQRPVTRHEGRYWVQDRPLAFFHFSGLEPLAPEHFSRHQNRLRLRDLGDAEALVREYCRRVLDNGQRACRVWSYAFGKLADGTPITDAMRQVYRETPAAQTDADPFRSDHDYLNAPWKGSPLVSVLMRRIWQERKDLQEAFPDLLGRDRLPYAHCFLNSVAQEMGVAERYLQPIRHAVATQPALADDPVTVASHNWTSWALRLALRTALRLWPFPVSTTVDTNSRTWARWCLEWFSATTQRELRAELQRFLHWRAAHGRSAWAVELVAWLRRLLGRTAPPAPKTPGLNIVGYVSSEHGIGESARLCAQAAEVESIPFALVDYQVNNPNRQRDQRWCARLDPTHPHEVNLLHINADQMPAARGVLSAALRAANYNIGYWHWELPELPVAWRDAFTGLDEVWVPTTFVQQAVEPLAPVPVVRIPHGIRVPVRPTAARAAFGLPERGLLVLTSYDLRSVVARKNPEAVLAAFRRAFGTQSGPALLVVKVNNPEADPAHLAALRQQLAEFPGAVLLDRILSRQEVYDLQAVCDLYISLHRAEGFGLGLAECMYLGKPVIGTGWSGNSDFMTARNSCPVGYSLVTLDRDHGPYPAGQVWAEPDIDHAAWYLRRLVEDRALAQRLGDAGQQTIRTDYSPERVGQLYRARLVQLGLLPAVAVRLAA